MCNCGACLPRAIMSSSCAFCCLLLVKRQKRDFFVAQSIIKQLLNLVVVISRIISR